MLSVFIEWSLYALLSLSIGSFSAAFIKRWPIKSSYLWSKEAYEIVDLPFDSPRPAIMSWKRSHCFTCQHTLNWFDTIPLISFVLLQGKCRHCNESISWHYPAVELLHLVICLPIFWIYEDAYQIVLNILLLSALITAAAIDHYHQLIPEECSTLAIGCALLMHLSSNTLDTKILAMIVGYVIVVSLRWYYLTFKNQEGIGLGDAKIIAAIGAWLGLYGLTPVLLCASLSGILYTLLISRKQPTYIAFGPFLIFSAIMVFYFTL